MGRELRLLQATAQTRAKTAAERMRCMMAKKTDRTMPDSYFRLVRQFPLAHLQDDAAP